MDDMKYEVSVLKKQVMQLSEDLRTERDSRKNLEL